MIQFSEILAKSCRSLITQEFQRTLRASIFFFQKLQFSISSETSSLPLFQLSVGYIFFFPNGADN